MVPKSFQTRKSMSLRGFFPQLFVVCGHGNGVLHIAAGHVGYPGVVLPGSKGRALAADGWALRLYAPVALLRKAQESSQRRRNDNDYFLEGVGGRERGEDSPKTLLFFFVNGIFENL